MGSRSIGAAQIHSKNREGRVRDFKRAINFSYQFDHIFLAKARKFPKRFLLMKEIFAFFLLRILQNKKKILEWYFFLLCLYTHIPFVFDPI